MVTESLTQFLRIHFEGLRKDGRTDGQVRTRARARARTHTHTHTHKILHRIVGIVAKVETKHLTVINKVYHFN